MKKLLIILSILVGSTFAQSYDTYLILNRFIGYNDPTIPDQVQWAPTLSDNATKFYVYTSKMLIENGDDYIIGDGIESSETTEYSKASYKAVDHDGVRCTVTLQLHKDPEYFHIYFVYTNWVLGYNLKLLRSGK
jgi:hypothetical protein